MSNLVPFEHLFEEIADLIAMTQKNGDKGISDKELDDTIDEQIDDLEMQIELFRKITDEALRRSGIDETAVKRTIQDPEGLGNKEKRILDKANKLKAELDTIHREYAKMSNQIKIQKKKAKSAGKKRIKKFKRLGGQGWVPL